MSLTMQRLLPAVVLPMLALTGLGMLLHKGKDAVAVESPALQTESCAVSSGAAIDATRVICLVRPGVSTARLYLHDLTCATCAPEPITESNEHISGFGVTSDGKHVLFVSDAAPSGRAKNFSIFRYDIDQGTRVELTPSEGLDRDTPRLPSKRPDLAIYSARAEGESQTKVFVQPIDGEAPKLVYVDPEPGELVDVSDDGTRGVYRRFISPDKSVYIAIDLRKRES